MHNNGERRRKSSNADGFSSSLKMISISPSVLFFLVYAGRYIREKKLFFSLHLVRNAHSVAGGCGVACRSGWNSRRCVILHTCECTAIKIHLIGLLLWFCVCWSVPLKWEAATRQRVRADQDSRSYASGLWKRRYWWHFLCAWELKYSAS